MTTVFSTARRLAATPGEVFAAISQPERLARWWGPDGFSNRFDVFDFRPGGSWIFDMIGPDGTIHPNRSEFETIEPGRRVVIRHLSAPRFRLAITLEPAAGGTLIRWEQAFDDDAVAQAVRPVVEPANEQNLDRLSAETGSGGAAE